MDTRDIEKALRGRLGPYIHYKGIFNSDNLPFIPYNSKPVIFISNTLASTADISTVGHWVSFYTSFYPVKRLFFYDSYGLSPHLYSRHFSKYIRTHYNSSNIYYFDRQLQPNTSQKCGLYVVNFIHYVSYYKLDKFISYYNIKFTSRNLRQNDALVTSYYFKHLSNARTCTFWKPSGKFKRAITYAECVKYKR